MKHLLIFLTLALSTAMTAQSFRLLADGGIIAPTENGNKNGITSHLSLEMLVPVATETYLTIEAGASYRSQLLLDQATNFDAVPFPNGIIIGNRFTELETYRVSSQHFVSGVGIEQQVNRFRVQLSGRVGYRLAEQIRFREETLFSGSQPMNQFDAEVVSGETFAKGMQTHRIDLNKRWRFQLGTSVRYTLTQRLEIGLASYYDLGNYRMERRVVSFCENCPVNDDAEPERSVKNRGIELLLSTRFVL